MATVTAPPQTKHSLVLLAALPAFLALCVLLTAVTIFGIIHLDLAHHDTLFFWESGRLLVGGHNPYDMNAFRDVELAMGAPLHGHKAIMTLEPPFLLPLLLPLELLSGQAAVFAWAIALLCCLGVSIWAVGDKRVFMVMAFFFPAALVCIETGQTGLICLLGIALFLRYCEKNHLFAGAALCLCAIKPHLLLPFFVVVSLWVTTGRRWKIAIGAGVAASAATVIVMAFDPHIWGQYIRLAIRPDFANVMIPRLGAFITLLTGQHARWLNFIPAAIACVWALWYFLKNRERWDWTTHGSLLIIVSLIVAPYSWFTDAVILIPPTLLALRHSRKGSIELLLVVVTARGAEALIAPGFFGVNIAVDSLLLFAWLGWYLFATSTGRINMRKVGVEVALALFAICLFAVATFPELSLAIDHSFHTIAVHIAATEGPWG